MNEQALTARRAALEDVLHACAPLAVAVSGGVDSMTLSHYAHQALGPGALMVHAASPAVPRSATARVRDHAARFGWKLIVLDAGEFDDEAYLANPVNRCLFCKTNLYTTLAAETERQLVSGTNLDDLGDYRPGLEAAAKQQVRHPFVEAGIDKLAGRALARGFGLDDIAALPASPCLSSRVETGIRIDATQLPQIDAAERLISARLDAPTVRCRVRRSGVVIELDATSYSTLARQDIDRLGREIGAIMAVSPSTVSFAPYRQGSAFLRLENEGRADSAENQV
ncbi:MAG: adenine nucleotide alpha hydrolase [Pseudomonadota bacterium]